MNDAQEELVRQYAAGESIWSFLRERGFKNHATVIGVG
jgi:hypothetical protein